MKRIFVFAGILALIPSMAFAQGGSPSNAVAIWGQDSVSGKPCIIAPAPAGSATCILPGGGVVSGTVAATQSGTWNIGSVTTLPSLPAGSAIFGSNLGRTSRVSVTPTVTASSAYTAGNEVGGLMTFASVFGSADSGIVQSIRIKCLTVQTTGFKLYLFNANPTNSTWTDKSAPSINAADIPYLIGQWTLSSPDSGLGTETAWTIDGVGASVVSTTTGLYGVMVATGTPTFGSTSDCAVSLHTLQD